ncbi:MAG: hypothetical protein IPM25_08255 [Chloracidobacterium sp.]|nr:hypothetical protein [Chloracidobacterium sp.]
MLRRAFIGTIFSIAMMAGIANAQHVKIFDGTSYEPATENKGFDTITIHFTGLESPDIRFFMARVPVNSREECLASRPLSAFVPVDAETAWSTYDPFNNTTTHTWVLRGLKSSGNPVCEILTASSTGDVDLQDYNVWRTNFGSAGRPEVGNADRSAKPEPYLQIKMKPAFVSSY